VDIVKIVPLFVIRVRHQLKIAFFVLTSEYHLLIVIAQMVYFLNSIWLKVSPQHLVINVFTDVPRALVFQIQDSLA